MAEVTETRQSLRTENATSGSIGLVAVFKEDGLRAPRLHGIVHGVCRIGRDDRVALRLDDSQASREHAEVEPAEGGLWIRDLGSRNGTFLDGQRIGNTRQLARPGATLRCGKTLLSVVENVEAYADQPSLTSGPLVGGPSLERVRRTIAGIAELPAPVLIEGETGTGKEKVAEALHHASGRTGAYVALNCAAIPAELVEAELFGHTRGAFSGSKGARLGLIRTADGGTLLLDELGDLPLAAQAKLLRVLDTGEVRPVGEDRAQRVATRVVAATNLDLDALVTEGRFRADLRHRLSSWRILMPPLRSRREDIPALVAHFSQGQPLAFAVESMEQLMTWPWPGNVRELKNAVSAALMRASFDKASRVAPHHIELRQHGPSTPREALVEERNDDELLRVRVETALALREGNVVQVAKDLELGRASLYRLLHRLGIEPERYRRQE